VYTTVVIYTFLAVYVKNVDADTVILTLVQMAKNLAMYVDRWLARQFFEYVVDHATVSETFVRGITRKATALAFGQRL